MADKKIVVGLGNPGKKYSTTRHNLGAMVVEALAAKRGAFFKKKLLLQGQLASCMVKESKLLLFLPTTYMNVSGAAVKKALSWFSLALEDLIVIVDDVDLPFGSIRYREKGSSGGHNGLKDIERQLGSQEYARLRMGIGPKDGLDRPLEDFVLSNFSASEREELPHFIEKGVATLEELIGTNDEEK